MTDKLNENFTGKNKFSLDTEKSLIYGTDVDLEKTKNEILKPQKTVSKADFDKAVKSASSFGGKDMETIDQIMKNPKLKKGVDIFLDEQKLAQFNNKFDGIQKMMKNPILQKFAGGASAGGGSTAQKIDRFSDMYTKTGKDGKRTLKKLGVVLKEAFKSGGGFFSGIWRSTKALFGYRFATKYKDELLLWRPARDLAQKVSKHADDFGKNAKKVGGVAGTALSEMKEHKSDKLALDAMKRQQKSELNKLFKKGSKIDELELVKKTNKIYANSFDAGMKADPDGFKKQLRAPGGVGGMKMVKGVGGLMVAQMGVDMLITGLQSDSFGDFKENYDSWEKFKKFIPGYSLFTGSQKMAALFQIAQEKGLDNINHMELLEAAIDVGFGAADILFIASGPIGFILKGKVKKTLAKKFTQKEIKDAEKDIASGAVEKRLKKEAAERAKGGSIQNVAKTGTKAARSSIISMTLPNIKNAFLKFTPSGRIFSRLFLNKEQKRFIRNMS
jgi:hypothetical protein